MRAFALALLITGLAAPAVAQVDPGWQRRRNEAAMAREADRLRAARFERESRARQQQARTEATLRAIRAGELAGGPPVAVTPYRPSDIEPLPPRPSPTGRNLRCVGAAASGPAISTTGEAWARWGPWADWD